MVNLALPLLGWFLAPAGCARVRLLGPKPAIKIYKISYLLVSLGP